MSDSNPIEALGDTLSTIIDAGFKLPFYVAVVGGNGTMIYARYTQGTSGLYAEVLVQYLNENEALKVPINAVIVDARGEAVRVELDKNSPPQILH